MQGRKDYIPKMMYQFHLDELVPKDNFYRQLDSALDLHFLFKATECYYGGEGQEPIDPVVFFKICLIGYLNNINEIVYTVSFRLRSNSFKLSISYIVL